MNTQTEVKPRPDRPLTNTNHAVVDAHGAVPDHVEASDFDGHLNGEFPGQGENDERVVKASSKVTAGQHITSKDGLRVAAERKASNEGNRKEHQRAWESDKLTVCPERRKRK